MLTVHLRVNDATTKQPTPVRLSVHGPNAEYYAPFGRLIQFPLDEGEDQAGGNLRIDRHNWCVIDGACEIRLPTDVPLRIRVKKGPEYTPIDSTVTLGPGQMALRFEIARWMDSAVGGWIVGDSRVHHQSPHGAALEAAAEGVHVVNLLASVKTLLGSDGTTYPVVSNIDAISGQSPALSAHGTTVVGNTLNRHRRLGAVGLLNCHRIVHPLAFGDPFDSDDWSILDWCNQCHRKNGLSVWVDAFRADAGLVGGEALLAAILGKIDAIEFDSHPRTVPLIPWLYRLWNAGVRVPLVGGSGKDSNRTPIGSFRTYAKPPDGQTGYAGWIEGVRAGRTFITNGPMLTLTEGTAEAVSAVRFEKLELLANGQVLGTTVAVETQGLYRATVTADVPDKGWYAARCIGGSPLAFAHTSPVWMAPHRDPDAVKPFLKLIETTRDWAHNQGRYQAEKWRTQLIDSCDRADGVLTS